MLYFQNKGVLYAKKTLKTLLKKEREWRCVKTSGHLGCQVTELDEGLQSHQSGVNHTLLQKQNEMVFRQEQW